MRLVPATLNDAAFLFRLRNDPLTRAMSADQAPIAWPAHLAWLEAALGDPRRALYIAHADAPVGTGRIDREARGAALSWTIAPERRGQGQAGALIAALVDIAPAGLLIARIRAGNAPSRAAAARNGFSRESAAGDLETWTLVKA